MSWHIATSFQFIHYPNYANILLTYAEGLSNKTLSLRIEGLFLPVILPDNFHRSSIMNFVLPNSDSQFIILSCIIPLFCLLLAINPAFIQ